MTNFDELLLQSKNGNTSAITEILEMYQPLLIKESLINGVYDEDLYQEFCLTLLQCINKIRM